jgi:dihydrofolate synthase / folylpolyglutamate synthase
MRPEADAAVEQWLGWLETLHPAEIEFGLERTAAVADRLGLHDSTVPIITVAGTNGKGSVCAFLEAILAAAGWRVGRYTSPHLERYHERVRAAGEEIDDVALRASFAAVDEARGEIPLTFFEFGTLAAVQHFRTTGVDVMVLETGLGGRLDATNVFAADVAVVTSIGVDHAEWLGTERNGIAREKAGIARAGRPLVVAEPDLPSAWDEIVAATAAAEIRQGRDYSAHLEADGETWCWRQRNHVRAGLPLPALAGGYQIANAATAVTALTALRGVPPDPAALAAGLRWAHVPGRFEVLSMGADTSVEAILDVGHNPQAAAMLAQSLRERAVTGRTLGLIGVQADKDIDGIVTALADVIDAWYCLALPPPRGRDAGSLAARVRAGVGADVVVHECDNPQVAANVVRGAAASGDRVVVTGSFSTVARMRGHFL